MIREAERLKKVGEDLAMVNASEVEVIDGGSFLKCTDRAVKRR